MKRYVGIYLDDETIEQLEKTGNKSGTANKILKEVLTTEKPKEEILEEKENILKQLQLEVDVLKNEVDSYKQAELKQQEEHYKIIHEIDDITEWTHNYFQEHGYEEYKQGIKDGKWRSTKEFYYVKNGRTE